MIPPSRPAALVRGREQGVDFVTVEKADLFARVFFPRDGEHPLDLCCVGRQFERREAEEGMNGGEPCVSAAHAQSALRFQFIEERHDQWRIDLLEVQLRGFPVKAPMGEAQELAERIPVGTDGVRARLAPVASGAG